MKKLVIFIALISVIFTGCASTKNSYSSNSGGGQANKNLVNFTTVLKKAGGFSNQDLTGAVPVTKKTAVFYNTKQIILTSKKVNNKAGVVEDYSLVIGGLDSIVIEPGTSFVAEKVTDNKVALSCKVDDIVFSLSYADDGKVYLLESQQDEKHTAVVTDDEGKFRTVRYHYLLSGTREFMLKEGDGDVLQISQEFLDNNLHQVKGVINN